MTHLCYGDEPYLLEQMLEKAVHGKSEFDVLITSETEDAIEFLNYPSFAGGKKTAVLKLSKLGANEALLAYMKKTDEDVVLLVIAEIVDRNTKVFKAFKSNKAITECNKLKDGRLREWLENEAERLGVKMAKEAVSHFISRSDYENTSECTLYTLNIYLNQLQYLSDENIITKESIDLIMTETLNEKMFSLSTYLLRKEKVKLMRAAECLIGEEDAIAMLSAMLRTFRIGYKASLLKGCTKEEIGKKIGVGYYQCADALLYSPAVLCYCMEKLQDAVNKIKSGYLPRPLFITVLEDMMNVLEEGTAA